MTNIEVTVSPALARGEHAKQLPFAISRTINDTLKVAQTQFLATLPSHFTLRGKNGNSTKPGTALGFNIKFASKSNLVGTLGSRANWWPLQETGGVKRAEGHRLAIPEIGTARPTKTEIIPAKFKPRRLLANTGDTLRGRGGKTRTVKRGVGGFIFKLHDGRTGVFARIGNEELRLWYMLKPTAYVKPALGFFATTSASIGKTFGKTFNSTFDKAVASAK